MMDSGAPTVKEQKILEQSHLLLKQLYELETLLNNTFDKAPKKDGAVEGRVEMPNVLDEIIDNLSLASIRISDTSRFINNNIIRKLV